MPITPPTWLGIPPEAVDLLRRGEDIAEEVVRNAKTARDAWALWEAINARLDIGGPLHDAMLWHAPAGFGDVRSALSTTAILAMLRVSENPQSNESLSACLLSSLLSNDSLIPVLLSETWITRDGVRLPKAIVEVEKTAQIGRIDWFKKNVPSGWSRGCPPPEEGGLELARAKLRELRNRKIAHALAGDFERPTIDEVRTSLEVSTQVAKVASLIFLGNSSGLDMPLESRVHNLGAFWDAFEHGHLSRYAEWRTSRGER